MPYDAPDYVLLKGKTDKLQQSFAQLTKRYTSPSYQNLRDKFLKLEDLYKKKLKEKEKGRWIKCLPDKVRLEQIGCISQLAGNMPTEQTVRNKDELEMAQSILIGSGLYRYSRIANSYKILLGFFGEAQENSALNMALHEALGLSDENNIDPLTWAVSCSAYRDYLVKNDNFTSYSYVNNDPYFFSHLDNMIKREQEKAQPMIKQLQYIVFIQSILKMLNAYSTEVQQLTSHFKNLLDQKLLANETLNKDEVLKLVQSTESKINLHQLYVRILPENYSLTVRNSQIIAFDGTREEEFETDIQERITVYCQYALLAAYTLVLTKINEMQKSDNFLPTTGYYNEKALVEALKKSLRFAICDRDNNPLDDEACNLALTSLQLFVDLGNCSSINAEVWGGVELFKGELHRQLVNVRDRLTELSREVSASAMQACQ